MIPSSLRESLGYIQEERERELSHVPGESLKPALCLAQGWGQHAEESDREILSPNSYRSHYLLSAHHEPDAVCIASHFSLSVREA